MEKPESATVDAIIGAVDELRILEASTKQQKLRINDLLEGICSESNKEDSATFLYWNFPEVSAKRLQIVLHGNQNPHQLLAVVGVEYSDIDCKSCGKPLVIRSRTALTSRAGAVCEPCLEESREIHREWMEQKCVESDEHANDLRTMPYAEYLKTDEWNERRKRQLRFAGYRCQVCNTSGTVLDVHHRTYERRGDERNSDLTVLCRACHSTFHGHS